MLFVNPLWFFAAAAVIIPVIIHLWNLKPGRTLKVGSISLFDTASRQRNRSLNLLNLLLLLLRCFFLILLAFLLAKPFIQKKQTFSKQKGWLLIPKGNFNETYNKFKHKTDSLLKLGCELHYFEPGFERIDTLKAFRFGSSPKDSKPGNYWNTLKLLNEYVPAGTSVFIFTSAAQEYFRGKKPETNLNINWQIYTPSDSVKNWIDQAWFTKDKAIHVIEGISKPAGTFYSNREINGGAENSSRYTIITDRGRAKLSITGKNERLILIDTNALTIQIFADNNTADAGYVKAAIESIQQFTGKNISVTAFNKEKKKVDWLFWLSDKPFKTEHSQQIKNVLTYEPGKVKTLDSWFTEGDIYTITQGLPRIALHKSVEMKDAGTTIWHDGYGNPILLFNKSENKNIYSIASHFNPTWNDLVWDNNFPAMLLKLIFNVEENGKYNKLVIDKKVLKFERSNDNFYSSSTGSSNLFPGQYIWILLALVFLIERWLTFKTVV